MRGKEQSKRIWKVIKKTGIILLCLIVINQLIYAAIVPVIFFHAGFSQKSYETIKTQNNTSEICIEMDGAHLYGWECGYNHENILLYFGGDSVDSSKWLEEVFQNASKDLFSNFTLMTVDYPTFGKSEGIISENNFYCTAETLCDYAEKKYPDAKMYAMGYSIGAAAALWLSTQSVVDGIILVAPMYDGTSMYLPRGTVIHDAFENIATVRMQNDEFAVICYLPTLVIASETDRMTKLKDIRELCDLFPNQPDTYIISDCAHGEYWKKCDTYNAIIDYFKKEFSE